MVNEKYIFQQIRRGIKVGAFQAEAGFELGPGEAGFEFGPGAAGFRQSYL